MSLPLQTSMEPGPKFGSRATAFPASTVSLGLLIVSIFGLYAWVVTVAFQHPSNQSSFDRYWLYFYVGFGLMVGVLIWVRQGRLLLCLSLLAVVVLLLASLIRRETLLAWIMLLWLVVLALALGERVLSLVAGDIDFRPIERPVFASAIGFGLLTILVFGIAAAQVLYAPVILGALILITLLLWATIRGLLSGIVAWWRQHTPGLAVTGDVRLLAFLTACGAVAFGGGLVWALAPETRYDALNYQLGVPAIYVQKHGLVELPYTFSSYFIGNAGMLYALALSVVGQPLPQLIHLLFGLLLAILTGLLGVRLKGLRVGLLSATIFYTLPLVTWESGTAYIDLLVSLYAFGAAYAALVWSRGERDAWLVICSLMAGLAVATKLNAVVVLLPVALLIGYRLLLRWRAWPDLIKIILLRLALPAAIVSAPWFVVRIIWTGNPVFPFLNAIFRSPHWPAVNETFNFAYYGRGADLWALVLLPWNLFAHGDSFIESAPSGQLGLVPLLSLPLFLVFSDREGCRSVFWPLAIFVMGLLIWFKAGQQVRFLLPLLPLAALLAALNLDALYEQLREHKTLTKITHAIALLLGLSYLVGVGLVTTLCGWSIVERYPFRVAFGLESPAQFLSRVIPVYDAFDFLNQQEGGRAKVLAIGNELRLYTTAQIEGNSGTPQLANLLVRSADASLAEALRAQGYQYLLINWTQVNAVRELIALPILKPAFLSRHFRLTFARHNVYVYKLTPPEPAREQSGADNLLTNSGFETLTTEQLPAEWFAIGKPVMGQGGELAHGGKVAVRANKVDGLFTRVAVNPGQLYTLGHWTRADRQSQFARLQINWHGADAQLVDVSIEVVPAGPQWAWHQIIAMAPARATSAYVYVSVHEDSEVWFDDYLFVRGEYYSAGR